MKDAVIFKLQEPIKYGTDNKETDFVEIRCPSYNSVGQRRYRRNLKAAMAAILADEGKEANKDEAKLKLAKENAEEVQAKQDEGELPFPPGLVLITVSAALGDGFADAVDQFCEHAKEICFLGGEEAVKSGTMNRIHPDDVDMMFSTFIANFIMPSLLKNLSGNE